MSSFLLPSELLDVVAHHVFDGGRFVQRSTLKACMLVNKEFAAEFRKYHFRVLCISERSFDNPEGARHRLKEWRDVLVKNPTYKPLVTKVILALTAGIRRVSPLTDDDNWHHLKALLEELNNVQMVEIISIDTDDPVRFHEVSGHIKTEILRLCALPSVKAITIESCVGISPRVVLDAPNLSSLRLSQTMFSAWYEETARSAGMSPASHNEGALYLYLDDTYGVDDITEFLGRVTHIASCGGRSVGAAAEAASLTGSLRVLAMLFPGHYSCLKRSTFGPLRIPLAGAHDLRIIQIVLQDTIAEDPYYFVDGLIRALESLPTQSKLDYISIHMKQLKSMAILMPPDSEYQLSESGDEGTTGSETAVVAATTSAAPPALASTAPAPRRFPRPSPTPVPWSELTALVTDKTRFPVLQAVTLVFTVGHVDEDTDFEEWGRMYKRLQNVFAGMGGIGYLIWNDTDSDDEDD